MSQSNSRIALELARKQKRLKSWKNKFEVANISEQLKSEIADALNTYSLLIAKIATGAQTSDNEECEERILAVERCLAAAFDAHRLAKSPLSPIKK